MWAAPLEEALAAKQWPRGHHSKDQGARRLLLETTTKESGVPGSPSSSGLARGGKDQREAHRHLALRSEAVVRMSPRLLTMITHLKCLRTLPS